MHLYIRASKHSNGGVLFRCDLKGTQGRHYEIQIHDVEGAVYPTDEGGVKPTASSLSHLGPAGGAVFTAIRCKWRIPRLR